MRITRLLVWFAIPMAVLTTACASTPRVADDGCELSSADSVHLAGGAVYRDCGVDRPARFVEGRVDFQLTAGSQPRNECFTGEVEFVVGTDGRPEIGSARLVRASHPAFGDAVLASVPGWKYTPASLDGTAVRQVVRERRIHAVRVATMVVGTGGGMPSRPTPPRGPTCR